MELSDRPQDMIVLAEQTQENGWLLQCKVPEDLLYFDGHFTGSPVVAGVVQLKWVCDTVTRLSGRAVSLTGMEAVKFHQLLFPNQTFTLELKRKGAKWLYKITSGEAKIASGRFLQNSPDPAA